MSKKIRKASETIVAGDKLYYKQVVDSKKITLADALSDYGAGIFDQNKWDEITTTNINVFVQSLKSQERNPDTTFFIDYAKLLRHSLLPLFNINDMLLIYKGWKRNPKIINALLFFADCLKEFVPLKTFWNQIIPYYVTSSSCKNLKACFYYFNRLIPLSFIKPENENLIKIIATGIFENGFVRNFDLQSDSELKSTVDERCFYHFSLFKSMLNELESPQKEFDQTAAIEFCKVFVLLDDSWILKDAKFNEYYFFIERLFSVRIVVSFLRTKGSTNNYSLYNIFYLWKSQPQLFQDKNFFIKHKELLPITDIGSFVLRNLLSEHEIPEPFLFGINYLAESELRIVLHILQGNSLKTAEGLPFKLSKRTTHIFSTLYSSYPKMNIFRPFRNFQFYLLMAELIALGANPKFAAVVYNTRVFSTDLPLAYWIEKFKVLIRIKLPSNNLQEVVDFIYHSEILENQPVNLDGVTVKSLMNRVDDWHIDLRMQSLSSNYENVVFPDSGISIYKERIDSATYVIEQIKTTKELFAEGEKMHHCVFSYLLDCKNGYSFVFSLRQIAEKANEHLITIELRNRDLVQAKGKYNRGTNAVENQIIRNWIKANDDKINQIIDLGL